MTSPTKQKRIDAKAAARNYLRKGMSFKDSIIAANGSPKQAAKGLKALLSERKALRRAFISERKRQVERLAALGAEIGPELRHDFVLGGLIDSSLRETGAPKIRALELIGREKSLNMFQPEASVGIFNMQIPSGWESRYLTTERSAVAQTEPKVLPAKFVHAALESGKVEIPDKLHVENEPVPVTVPSPTTSNFSEDDFETL